MRIKKLTLSLNRKNYFFRVATSMFDNIFEYSRLEKSGCMNLESKRIKHLESNYPSVIFFSVNEIQIRSHRVEIYLTLPRDVNTLHHYLYQSVSRLFYNNSIFFFF